MIRNYAIRFLAAIIVAAIVLSALVALVQAR
jgi:hypothetical protein